MFPSILFATASRYVLAPELSSFEFVVSIINYRTADLTKSCLSSVVRAFSGLSFHVVVVDNNSGDGSADAIETWIKDENLKSDITLVRSPTNTGFSGGHNIGMTTCAGEFYLILNSDAVLAEDFGAKIKEAVEHDPDAGMFAPRINYDDGEQQVSCFRFPSWASELDRGASSGPISRILSSRLVPLDMPPRPEQIEWASFACILLRAEMVREIGPMDDGYFLYFEDCEYCLRARRSGWQIRYVHEATAVHYRGGSGPVVALAEERKRLPAYYYASRTRFLYQKSGLVGLWLANLAWHLGRVISVARPLFGKPRSSSIYGEPRDIWTNSVRPMSDRKRLEA